jgi:hypothetical protein
MEDNDPLMMSNMRVMRQQNSYYNKHNPMMNMVPQAYMMMPMPVVRNGAKHSSIERYSMPAPKKTSFINQLPMQDFHLEQWRSAYKNIGSATRHFYTGSSFPAVAKIQ